MTPCLILGIVTVLTGGCFLLTWWLHRQDLAQTGEENHFNKDLADLESQLVKFHTKHSLAKVVKASNPTLSLHLELQKEGNKHIYNLVVPDNSNEDTRNYRRGRLYRELYNVFEESLKKEIKATKETDLKTMDEVSKLAEKFRDLAWESKKHLSEKSELTKILVMVSSVVLGGFIGELISQIKSMFE